VLTPSSSNFECANFPYASSPILAIIPTSTPARASPTAKLDADPPRDILISSTSTSSSSSLKRGTLIIKSILHVPKAVTSGMFVLVISDHEFIWIRV
jgi:hypothetical protein